MVFYLRTLRCDPGATYGTVIDREPYETLAAAVAERDTLAAEEEAARANGERPRDWFVFDVQEVVPETPVGGGRPVPEDSNGVREARAWARRKMKDVLIEIGKERLAAAAASGEE